MKNDARFVAYKILKRFNAKNRKVSLIINEVFNSCSYDEILKSRSTVLVNDIIRLQGRLDLMIKFISGKNIKQINQKCLLILRIGFYELVIDKQVPDYAAVNSAVELAKNVLNLKSVGFVNAILRKLSSKKCNLKYLKSIKNKHQWYSLPLWLQKRWIKNFGQKDFTQLARIVNKIPTNFLRIDSKKHSADSLKKELNTLGIKSEKFLPNFLEIQSGLSKVFETNLFNNGQISIQNPASAAIVDILNVKNGDTVLDVCAAPGTKSLYLANIVGNEGKVLASDISPDRVKQGEKDFFRHHKNNIEWYVKDASKDKFPAANRILIDAPCSGTGVIARKPDIRWLRKPSDINRMAKLQYEILDNCAHYLNPNGVIIYSTCSIEPEENWNVVEKFLKMNDNFILDKINSKIPKSWIDRKGTLKTLPHIHGVDGMFAAKLKRLN